MYLDIQVLLNNDLLLLNRGAIAEQFVAQELIAYQNRHQLPELFYWARDVRGSSAEVDFVTTINSKIIPVEVKSGTTGKLKSLKMLMQERNFPVGIRISQQPLAFENNILSIPFYMISEIPRFIQNIMG